MKINDRYITLKAVVSVGFALVAVFLFASIPARAAGASVGVIQASAGSNNFGGAQASTAFATGNTAGDTVVVLIQWMTQSGASAVSSITDSRGNHYTLIPGSLSNVGPTAHYGNIYTQIAYAANVAAGANTVTVAWNQQVASGFASLLEISPSNFDQAIGGTGTSNTPNAGNITTSASGAFAAATAYVDDGFGGSNAFTAGSGWTLFQNAGGGSADQGSEYRAQTTAGTLAGNFSAISGTWVASMATFVPTSGGGGGGGSDTTPPSIPANLSATAISSSQINLSWAASTDNVGVTGYKIFRNGSQIGTSATNSYSDVGLSASTSYTYTVSAYDAAGNNSSQSVSASATTQASVGSGGASGNIYIAQSSAGSANGTNCANAYPVSFFNTASNWGNGTTQIGPGDTVHLCGTFTGAANGTMLQFQGSGTSGNPITLKFEPGAILDAPYWYNGGSGTGGAINLEGKSYVTVDGGTPCGYSSATNTTTPCNGEIENTADGTNLAYHAASLFIEMGNCTNCEIKNLSFQNLYQRVGTGVEAVDDTELRAIEAGNASDNVTIDHNVINTGGWCVTGGAGHVTINNNDIGNCEHDVATAPTHLYFHDNHLHDWAIWQNTSLAYHHDGLHCFAGAGGATQDAYIYNNQFDGDGGPAGTGMNQFIFLEGNGSPTACMLPGGSAYIYNNVFIANTDMPAESAIYGNSTTGDINDIYVNNTTIGPNPNTQDIAMGFVDTKNVTVENNATGNAAWLITDNGVIAPTYRAVDYNAYESCSSFNCFAAAGVDSGSTAVWKAGSCMGSPNTCDPHGLFGIGSSNYFNLNTAGYPQAGSPLIQAGANLSSFCAGGDGIHLVPLCSDKAGTPRPSSGVWDIGAYEVSSGGSGGGDTIPPTASITSPSSGATISGASVSVTATASDNVGVVKVEFYVDGTLKSTDTASPYSFILDTTILSNGSHALQAKAYDAAGNIGASVTVPVTVSNIAAASGNIYIAQSSAGSANGTNCANAYPVSFFNTASNWGNGTTQIGPGDTVHLCGTITGAPGSTGLTVQGSGTVGNPITILFEPGAQLNAPYWTNGILMSNRSYITVNGGTNGIVQNTANGEGMAYMQPTNLITASPCTGCTVENLSLANAFVHIAGSANTDIDQTQVRAIQFSGSNWLVTNNVIHDCGWCLEDFFGQGDSNVTVSNNNIYHMDHGFAFADGTDNAVFSGLFFHDNQVHDAANWDCTNLGCHHDGIHMWTGNMDNSSMNNIYAYNNYFYGSWGTTATGFIYVEDGNPSIAHLSNSYWWNNVFLVQNPQEINNQGWVGIFSGDAPGTTVFVNNTMIGPGTPDLTFCYGMGAPLSPMNNLVFENNVGTGCGGMITFNNIANTTMANVNHNYYGVGCSAIGQPYNNCFADNGNYLGSLSNWQSTTGFDAQSISNNSALFNANGSPQSGSPAIGAGVNLSSLAVGNLSTLALDTTEGNSRTPVARPSSGPWDIGAYELTSSGSGSPPADTTPPSITILSPQNNATVSSMVTISGVASDNVSVASVQISADGGAYQPVSGTNTWSVSWNTAMVSSGNHTLTVKAADASGNTQTASIVVNVQAAVTTSSGSGGSAPIATNISAGSSGGGGGGGGGGFFIPAPASVLESGHGGISPLSSSLLQSLLAELQALIARLNAQLVASFTRNLTIGSSGSDVKNLQIFLNDNGYQVASFGAGSPGDEVAYFGPRTQDALIKFQKASDLPATGYFGTLTRQYLEGKW